MTLPYLSAPPRSLHGYTPIGHRVLAEADGCSNLIETSLHDNVLE